MIRYGSQSGYRDVAYRMTPPCSCRFLAFLLYFYVRGISSKSIAEHGALEVQVRVQVFDSSDLSPLSHAFIKVHGNQSVLASSEAGSDGMLVVNFLYRPGTLVIITASKQDYITNSVPWHANRIPLYASVSLYLLTERPGTLILYDDIIQVFRGSPGVRNQPRVQLQRRSLTLNSSYADVSAVLTTTMAHDELASFPYLLGVEVNSTGGESGWMELTAVAAVSAQLFDREGRAVPVTESFHMSIPLPSDSRLRSPTSIPVWVYHSTTGVWLRNGTGYIKREGSQLTWEFMASKLGYWVAAFPSTAGSGLGHPGLRDITAYHTLFLLSILASLALLVLVLLCVLLYYCRRRCLKPRRQQGKLQSSAALNGSRRDQGTSMSRLNLICGGHAEPGTSSGDQDAIRSDASPSRDHKSARDEFSKHVPAHKLRHSKSKGPKGGAKGESFPMKVHRATETVSLEPPVIRDEYGRVYAAGEDKDAEYHRRNVANDNRGYTSEPPSPPPDKPPEYSQLSQAADHLARPTSLNTQPGQIIFCSSLDQMKENIYRSMVPTLVIPAHYMRLSSEFGSGEAGKDGQPASERDKDAQGGASGGGHQGQGSHQQAQQGGSSSPDDSEGSSWASTGPGGSVHIPVLFNDSTMAQMNGELQALTEKKLLELGVKQHPRAWFISLDGRANAHVRHSYIDVGSADLAGHHVMGHASSHSTPTTLSTSTHNTQPSSSSKDCSPDTLSQESQDRKPLSSAAYSSAQRKSKDSGRDERSGTGHRKGHGSSGGVGGGGVKPYSKLAYQDALELSGGVARMGASSPLENPLTPLLDEGPDDPRGSPVARKGRSRGNSSRSSNNSESRRDSVTSPEDDPDDKDGNKKSPWQRHEERPLMVFHPKK
ncbi:protein FAM171A2 isoform X1 [Alosa sapidissima]|uniref:protein FAM171A2 isoform X1 n=2 Tax=Alosa sapidissima TaxID=34773 RepID=UPI001C09A317|nr:protein FAM171A2 isoform X1 [Alosa sapidissima]